jgi:hypothetical protein
MPASKLVSSSTNKLPGDGVKFSKRSHLVAQFFETRYKLLKQEVWILHGFAISPRLSEPS